MRLVSLSSERPAAPSRVQLVRANTSSLEVSWGPSQTADTYLLQVQKYDIPAAPAAASPASSPATAPVPAATPVASSPKSAVPIATAQTNQAPSLSGVALVPSPTTAVPGSPLAATTRAPGRFTVTVSEQAGLWDPNA